MERKNFIKTKCVAFACLLLPRLNISNSNKLTSNRYDQILYRLLKDILFKKYVTVR